MRRVAVVVALLCWSSFALGHPGTALVADRQGNVYFAYWGGTWKWSTNGTLIRIHANDLHFLGIDVDARFDKANPMFLRLTPDRSRPALLAFPEYPATLDHDGVLYVAPWRPGRIRVDRIPPDGAQTVLADAPIDPRLARPAGRHEGGLLAVASGPRGVYVSDGASIWVVDSQGRIASIAEDIKVSGCPGDLPAELPKPHIRALAVDDRGTIYAAATGCRAVLRVSAAGVISSALRAETPWSPSGVTVTNDGVYVLEFDNPLAEHPRDGRPRLRRMDRNGNVSTLFVAPKAE